MYYVAKAGPKFTTAFVSAFLMLVMQACAITTGSANLFKDSSTIFHPPSKYAQQPLLVTCHSTQEIFYKVKGSMFNPPQTSWSFPHYALHIPCSFLYSLDKDDICTRNSAQYPKHRRNKVPGMAAHAFHLSTVEAEKGDPWGSLPVKLGLVDKLQSNERPCLKGSRQHS